MGGPLTIHLFGPIQVLVDEEPIPRVRSKKAIWLLALLTLRAGRPATREWVADALWPDAEGGQGLANLRPLISELRSALGSQGERLRVNDRTIALDLDGASVDVTEFDEAVRREDFARAVAVYGGQLLEGCSEEWAFQEQRIRQSNCLAALQSLGESALVEGRPEAARDAFTRAISIDPLRDAPRRGLMSALAATDDVNAALQSYREFARFLSSEVSTSPDKETTRLYEQLRAEIRRPPKQTAGPTPNNLPPPLNDLVGRIDESADVEGILRRSRLVTLTGVGGIGKTRLAQSVAAYCLPEYPGGVWFVTLESLAPGNPVIGAVAANLDVQDTSTKPLIESIVDRLRQGRCLLVLDNCEHVLEPVAELTVRLLHDCPQLWILATSREVLDIQGETAWQVPPLGFPNETDLPEGRATRRRVAEGYEGVQLFVERAKAAHQDFALTDENLPWVIDICAQVEGLPLGIELAAARVRSMAIETLRERLTDHHLETLQGRVRGQSQRQQALRATLDWSYALLDEEDRRMMARLAVFANGWTAQAAEAVCGSNETVDRLRSLVEKSIILFDPRTKRYRYLETVRQYASEKLEASGESDQIRAAHCQWCMDFAKLAQPGFRGRKQAEWLRLVDLDWPNLKKALDQFDQEPTFALRLTAALWYYWYIRSTRENFRYLEHAVERGGAYDPSARAEVLIGLGTIYYSEGDFKASKSALDESLDLFRSIGDKAGIARAFGVLGSLARVNHDDEQAVSHYKASLAMHRELDDRHEIALIHYNLASIAVKADDFKTAKEHFDECLTFSRERGTERLIAWSLIGLAVMAQRQGRASSFELESEALDLFDKLGDKRGTAVCLRHQGLGHRRQGEPGLALPKLEKSKALFRDIGDERNEAYSNSILALATLDLGDAKTAESLALESLAKMRKVQEQDRIADALYVLARLHDTNGRSDQAWACVEEVVAIRAEISDRAGLADALDWVAQMAVKACSDAKAAFIFGASEAIRDSVGATRFEVDEPAYQSHRELARSRLGAKEFDSAAESGRESHLKEVVTLAKEMAVIAGAAHRGGSLQ